CGLAAQDPTPKSPREPSIGRREKITEPAPKTAAAYETVPILAPDQQAPSTAPERNAASRALAALEAARAADATILFDQPVAGGAWWVLGPSYKASFDA